MDVSNYDFARVGKRVVEYIWDPIPKNDDTSGAPMWCLGQQYKSLEKDKTSRPPPPSSPEPAHTSSLARSEAFSSVEDSGTTESEAVMVESKPLGTAENGVDEAGWPASFLDDFEARVWLSYRSNFPPIPKSHDPKASSAMSFAVRFRSQFGNQEGFTSDTGWGCMIRSGQSLLANALFLLRLGRDWRRGCEPISERRLLSLFADDPRAPFSIHRFVAYGASDCGKHPGEWFGPSATTRGIQALAHEHRAAGLRVYSTGDGPDVYEDALFRTAKSETGAFQPTLILVGIRLGIDRITPVYWDGLQAMLEMPQSVGIAGGRPRASHYFVGNQGPQFFYLDPHHTRPALQLYDNPADLTENEVASCHTRRLRRIHVREMDPSMLIGFLVRNEDDWREWRRRVSEMPGKAIINVADSEPSLASPGVEREGAIDEVETLDDEDE